MDHKSGKQPNKKFFSGLVSVPHLVLCVVLAAMCTALVFTNLRMDRRNSAFNDALEELRRNGKEASVNVSDVSSGLGTRKKRSTSNKTPSQKSDFEKRLQAMEERVGALINKSEIFSTKLSAQKFFPYIIRGRDGRDGPAGPPGLSGKPGMPGMSGIAGQPGKAGPPGIAGPPSQAGPKGEKGKPGINKPFPGPPGPKGERGSAGSPGLRGLQGHKGEKGQEGAGKAGVKYVRWGRTTCPGSAQIVYKGITGGEHYNHPGGGVNYLCLPHNPKYGKYNDGNQDSGYMYGTEYEMQIPFKNSLFNHDAPCVVCFVESRGSMLMMPARNDCPSGWTEEYHGYLTTSYYNHNNQKDFICVDKDPEYVLGSHADHNGALLYPVEGQCGSLPCFPYVNHRELTCAVCTK